MNKPLSSATSPFLTGEVKIDLKILRKLDKATLLVLCETDIYVMHLCNTDEILYKIITTP